MVRKNFLKHSLSQEDFEKCLDGSGLALWRWDVARDIVTLSESAQKMLGSVTKGRNLITSVDLMKIVHPDDREEVLDNIRNHFRGVASFDSEFRIYIDDGQQINLRMVADSVRTPEGRVTHSSGYIQNITTEIQKDKDDHFNHHILEDFLENAPFATAILDKDLCYLSWSSKWREDFGILEKDLKGKSHLEICPVIERYKSVC